MTRAVSTGPLSGHVVNYTFSPKGGLEGLIVRTAAGVAQVVCPPHLEAGLARAVAEGDEVELAVEPAPPSDKGPAAHPVYHLLQLPPGDWGDGRVAGTVVRLNYTKHGEPNGVV